MANRSRPPDNRSLPPHWVEKFTDPYAVLGVAVTADDRRVTQRYRSIAMLLHPDRFAQTNDTTAEFAGQLLARLVNPANQKLKQEKLRREVKAELRFLVRRQQALAPQSELARQLMGHPASGVDVFYEQAVAQLAERQYKPLEQFPYITEQLSELNLVYLRLKMRETLGERPTALVSAQEAKPPTFTPPAATEEAQQETYDQRQYRRAKEYARRGQWSEVLQELRDAISIEPNVSEYHALLGVAYLHQNLMGMAKVHIKRALVLNPQEPLALRFAIKVGALPTPTAQPAKAPPPPSQPPKRTSPFKRAIAALSNLLLWPFRAVGQLFRRRPKS